jgi:type VI secretion system secreted protein VgrG
MADLPGSDPDAPTQPLPGTTPPIAPHVPIDEAPTAPYAPVPDTARGQRRSRTWLWVIVAALAAGALAAIITGIVLGSRGPLPVPTSSASPTPTTSISPSPSDDDGPESPAPEPEEPSSEPQPTQTTPPEPTEEPEPTETPAG